MSEPDPVEELPAHAVDHGVGHRRAVARRVDDDPERTSAAGRIDDGCDGARDLGRVGVIRHGAGERVLHAIGEACRPAARVLRRGGLVRRFSGIGEVVGPRGESARLTR